MGAIPTIRIKTDNKLGYMTINQEDFNKRVHEIYEPEPAKGPEIDKSKKATGKGKKSEAIND